MAVLHWANKIKLFLFLAAAMFVIALRPNIFKVSITENTFILIKIPLKFVSNGQCRMWRSWYSACGPINNELVLVQVMAWHWTGHKTSPTPMSTMSGLNI